VKTVRELERELDRLRAELEDRRREDELAMRELERQQRPRNQPRGNLSAYCIGASIGAGARHEQCPGTYSRRPCTCARGHRGY
jgi:hypothetical protein